MDELHDMDEARSILANPIQPLFKNFVLLSRAKMQKLGHKTHLLLLLKKSLQWIVFMLILLLLYVFSSSYN